MPRTTHSVASRKRKKKIFKRAKGFVGGRRTLLRTAKETVARAMAFATRDRKQRKRQFRQLWNVRINAACRENGLTYSRFINALRKANVTLNRKSLAEIAARDPKSFKEILNFVKKA
ncbi:MAG TPA: 50S ribosomal protein L20 [Candidatus Omnitrophota bacterium]|jgi:large subunit ribosomal protein L20|nr:50S ribosomal protein L20 [Candidatus Omnitrophota bacterium]HPW65044.1 50S ribosomal protein L20 [Candidatus Omnitrophota bacterium]HQB93855.1 50S ribosomal protein L20 [Candidatus Omnitrophota bacterium]